MAALAAISHDSASSLILPAIPVVISVTPISTAPTTATTTSTTAAAAATTIATTAATTTRSTRGTLFLEAITAIDRAIFAWDKRNRRSVTAGSANSFVLFAAPAAWALVRGGGATAPRLAALRAAARGIGQPLGRKKLLLTCCKGKLLATIAAGKDTVLVSLIGHHGLQFPFFDFRFARYNNGQKLASQAPACDASVPHKT
jgi:hypothetical protein